MRVKVALAATALAAAAALAAAPAASAATEFGSNCAANGAEPGISIVSISHGAGSPLPVAAPISGVITSWKTTNEIEGLPPELAALIAPRLELLRPATANSFTLVGEASTTSLSPGTTVYPSRLPVQAGDHLGIGGSFLTLFCTTGDSSDSVGVGTPSFAVGESSEFTAVPGIQAPVAATIEPDADHDGYGDETQDGCPQSAAYQSPCPVVTISSTAYAGKKKVSVYVASSLPAPVSVSGSVKLGKGKTKALAATAQPVAPGQVSSFALALPQSVLKQLKATPRSKKLAVSVTASATNVNGSVSTSAAKVKLPGQQKPPKHK